ncbi:hypothetical protein SALBM135S_01921 [Streptomyces alboniger]
MSIGHSGTRLQHDHTPRGRQTGPATGVTGVTTGCPAPRGACGTNGPRAAGKKSRKDPVGQWSRFTAVTVVFLKSATWASAKPPIWPHCTSVTVLPSRPTENMLMSEAPHEAFVWTP